MSRLQTLLNRFRSVGSRSCTVFIESVRSLGQMLRTSLRFVCSIIASSLAQFISTESRYQQQLDTEINTLSERLTAYAELLEECAQTTPEHTNINKAYDAAHQSAVKASDCLQRQQHEAVVRHLREAEIHLRRALYLLNQQTRVTLAMSHNL